MLTAGWGHIGTATTEEREEQRKESDHEEKVFGSI